MSVSDTDLANAIRALSMDAVEAANSGHPGMPMGMADVATVLFTKYLKFDPSDPFWADRDRFVLSAGHGSMLLYSLLHLTGYARPTIEDIRHFRQVGSPCAGHPENFELPGVECTTGPLGQGLAMAVGMAMAERHLNAKFGDELVDPFANNAHDLPLEAMCTTIEIDLMESIDRPAPSATQPVKGVLW